ncbi:NXPE family member 3-like [Aplochiton taeniatus]
MVLVLVLVLFWNRALVRTTTTKEEGPRAPTQLPTPYNKTHCFKYSGEKPSSKEAEEERVLLDSIAWPGPPAQLTATPPEQTSDPSRSTFTFLPAGGDGERHVGDQLEAVIHMHDFKGRHRPHGGDFLVARLHSPKLLAGVVGQVLDHGNGSYSAVFPLLWEGSAQPLCNYTDVLTGEPWFCYKPKVLGCHTRINNIKGQVNLKNLIVKEKEKLFRNGVNLKVFVPNSGSDTINVLPENKDVNGSRDLELGPPKVMPSGYYFQGEWRTLGGVTVRQFKDSSSITQCLQGKVVHMYGDSTVRQWYWFLRDAAGIKELDLHSPSKTGPLLAVDTANNIMLTFRFHGHPTIISQVTSVTELRYISNELDLLTGGSNTVVIIGVWAHFAVTPLEIYIRRLRQIRRALVLLLDRAPETVVVVRTGNPQRLDLQRSLVNGDWNTLQMNRLLRAMFKGMDVLLVDAWDMVLASHLPHNLHPPPPIIKNMVDHVLSYICPAKTNI